MKSLTFGDVLIIILAIAIASTAWGNPYVTAMATTIVAITIIEVNYRSKQFKRYIKKQDLEDLKKNIEELITSSEEFKRVNDAVIAHINKQP